MLGSLNILFFVGIVFTIYAILRRIISDFGASNRNKESQKKTGQLTYYDYSSSSRRMIDSDAVCYEYQGFDEDHRPYTYYVSKKKRGVGQFLGAKYDIFKDVPVKYTKYDINRFFDSGMIHLTDDLYTRWEGKRPWEMPEGTYNR